MRTLRAVMKWFFLTLGVVFFLILCALAYGWYAYDLGAYLAPSLVQTSVTSSAHNAAPTQNPILNTAQEAALRTVGIDPASIPTASTVTEEQKTCLLNTIGEARAREILTGAAPTWAELLSAKNCL